MSSSHGSHLCPHCNAKLRVKSRALLGKQVRCPDCRELLVVVADGPMDLRLEKAVEESHASASPETARASRREPSAPRPANTASSGSTRPSSFAARLLTAMRARWAESPLTRALARAGKRPGTVGWVVSGCLALLLTWAFWPRGDGPNDRPAAIDGGQNQTGRDLAIESPRSPTTVPGTDSESPRNRSDDDRPEAAARLENIRDQVSAYLQANGHFPSGTVGDPQLSSSEQFSWLALLAAEDPQFAAFRPLWERSWRDPRNARFVRQRLPEYQNPDVERLVGSGGYPATHFVGMAGVGEDAARLPVDHPRAGIFGDDRQTTVDDVKDGLSETILIAGVQDHVGAWAAGGLATVRGLVERPYVNGPDGFGTGQPNGMYVLMADGRVRFVADSVDPVAVEQMAAMADQSAADSATPGPQQGPRPPVASHPPPDADMTGTIAAREPVAAPRLLPPAGVEKRSSNNRELEVTATDDPAEASEPDPPEPIDVADALAQPIRRFEQRRSVPLETLLRQIEEMAGVSIDFDDRRLPQMQKLLETPVSLTLTDTSIGEILQAVVQQAGLSYDIEPQGVRLHRTGDVPPESTEE